MPLHQITTSDGCELQVKVTGCGPTLMLLHAGGPDRHSLDPFAFVLAEHYTVVQPDIRGYGASVCRDPAAHTWTRYAEDVVTVLDGLAEVSTDIRAALVGTGLGATIALRVGRDRADRIPRSDPESVAAAAFIGHDRSFRSVDDLAAVTAPTLIFAGTDRRHPRRLAEQAAKIMPRATLAATEVDATPRTPQDLADAFLPELLEFLARLPRWSADATEADR